MLVLLPTWSDKRETARQHDVDELPSDFALAHVGGSATVATHARDGLREKRRRSCRRGPTANRVDAVS